MLSPFVEWNRLLLAQFFPPAAHGEETWLQTTRVELDSIGLRLGGAEGLIAAVQAGPEWLADYQNIAEAACRLARQRNAKIHRMSYVDPGEVDDAYSGSFAPSYLPYLALWVLAASDSKNGFYASVEEMSARPFPNSIREQMLSVWEDLANWTQKCDGKFGFFSVRVLGAHRFVGIPRSQCLISPKDKKGLPHLFSECNLRPGQSFSEQTYRQVSSRAAHAYYLSEGLREAVTDPTYVEPLRHMLTAAFQYWDGKARRARSSRGNAQGQLGVDPVDPVEEVALVLRPGQSEESDWEIHWRIPAFLDAGAFDLTAGNGRWSAVIEELGTHASTVSPSCQAEARRLLACANDSDIEFVVKSVEGSDEYGYGIRTLQLPKCSLRTLVWDVPDPSHGNELIEGEVPIAGPCYVFFETGMEGPLRRMLGSSQARWEPFDSTGLPERWKLGCIHHCDLLSADQRQEISESPVGRNDKARIRLIGGRPLVRGGGRSYAFYDLPIIELEAQDDATLEVDGLELTPLGLQPLPGVGCLSARETRGFVHPISSRIRRYAMRITDEGRAVFNIRVVASGSTIAVTTLKVSVAGGKGTAQGRNFGIGSLGQRSSSGIRLLGVLWGDDERVIPGRQPTKLYETSQKNWKVPDGAGDLQGITDSVPAKFLDSLAQLGSIAYGTARDQLLRLAHQAQINVHPPLLLLELRGRGYLEIETDNEGHLIRVHAVPPILYTLPLRRNGRAVVGVCGTLRLQHWKDLGDCFKGEFWLGVSQSDMPVLWLAPNGEREYSDFVEMAGFTTAEMPSCALAEWSSGHTVARSTLSSWSWATLATEIRHLQRFQPTRAEFVAQDEPRLGVDPEVMASLYRFEDPTIQGLQVYVLGTVKPDGQSQFSFLQDSRWGIWLALSAFADFAKRRYGIGDATPWPIHYSASDGTLWLPARLRPPFVIERILLLCSASSPTLARLGLDRISPVYGEMATGTWLAYPWVPEDIAGRVAELLGGVLSPLA